MVKITFRIWLLIIFIAASLIAIFSIPPLFLQSGVIVKSVEANSTIFNDGLRQGRAITSINGQEIKSLEDYSNAMQIFSDIDLNETARLEIITDQGDFVNLYTPEIITHITVEETPNTRIRTGLDLQGGARALVKADQPLTDSQLDDLISVSQQRLNIYGLSDVSLTKVEGLSGEKFMKIEIAGSSPADLEELIAKQGVFEAKIGNQTVFRGGEKDITYVGRTGQDAMITECFAVEEGEACNFRFVIFLSEEAAQRHADITSKLDLDLTTGGRYLNQTIDFFLDGVATDSLNIGEDLKGKVATQIQISGSGSGPTRQEALENAKADMKKLQTVLITGSLPFKLTIEKIDRISPNLGENFTKQILLAAAFAILTVFILVFIRYRKLKISIALVLTSLSEVLIILGFAALFRQVLTLDLPAIAGIIAAIGTGIDSQIIILDESKTTIESLKQRIKNAFKIILTAFLTTLAALIPLTGWLSFMGIGAVSAGLLKGFALMTLTGLLVGVLITRPAFADIVKKIED